MDKETTGVPYRRPYRFVMGVLLLLVPFCTMVPYVAPAVFMSDIMESFGCDLGLAGLSMTIQLGATGVCMFIGTFIQDRLGVRWSIILSIGAMVLGNILAFLASGIAVFLIARLISGFGQGLYMVSMTPCLSTWFEGKERTYMISFNSIANAVALAISYSINRPLCNLLGDWQRVLCLYAVCIAVIGVIWLLFSKDSPEDVRMPRRPSAKTAGAKKESSLLRACREIQYWKIMVYAGIFYMTNTSIASYLPTYLTTERGIDPSIATSISSLNSLAGMAGSLLGGILAAQLKRRKPIMLFAGITYMLTGFGLTMFDSGSLILVLALLAGVLFNLPQTAQSSLMIETKQPFDPTILGGAVSITSGIGQLLCVLVSFIFSAVAGATSMTMAYRVFFALMLAGIVMVFLMRETGVRGEKKAE